MKICSPQLGISPDSNLGGEVHDREMLKALADLGARVDIILPWGKKHENYKNWSFTFLPVPFVYPPWLFNILILPYLFWIYWRKHFNVLRVHSPYFVGFAAVIFRFIYPTVKLVATYHHLENNRFYNITDRLLIKHFDLVVTDSNRTKKEVVRNFHVKAVVVPNGVDKKFRPISKVPGTKKVLLYLGQLIERKNIPFLFKVIKLLPQNYELIIAGEGPLRQYLESIAPERVKFLGKIEEKEKVKTYNQADVFVYPSKKEGFGLSILEALACGLPVITPPDLVENMEVKEVLQDERLWAREILLIKGKRSSWVGQYSWEKSAKRYLTVIKNELHVAI